MRSPIRKEVFAKFVPAFERNLPQFRRSGEYESGESDYAIWVQEIVPELTLFVMLQIFDNKDRFTLEVAWSNDGKFPWKDLGFRFGKIDASKCRGRLAELWVPKGKLPDWEIVRGRTFEETRARIKAMSRGDRDEVKRIDKLTDVPVEEAIPRVAPLVEDAVQKLIDFGLPLFRRVAEHRGLTWPTRDELPSKAVTGHVPGVR